MNITVNVNQTLTLQKITNLVRTDKLCNKVYKINVHNFK